ncbi:MAG: hypothetical protein ABW220_18800 [Burkholderiaceae bacterium]
MRHVPTTEATVEQLRLLAKRLQRRSGGKLGDRLDQAARGAGYDHWRHVGQCLAADRAGVRLAQLRHTLSAWQAMALAGTVQVEVTELLGASCILVAAGGDAWLLDPRGQACLCLAFDRELVAPRIEPRGAEVDLEFHGNYALTGDQIRFATALPRVGTCTRAGYPLAALRAATAVALGTSVPSPSVPPPDTLALSETLIDQLLARGFGSFDRRELQQAARDGATYAPARDALQYPAAAP